MRIPFTLLAAALAAAALCPAQTTPARHTPPKKPASPAPAPLNIVPDLIFFDGSIYTGVGMA